MCKSTICEILKKPYRWMLVPEAQGFSARILEFPGCFAEGATPGEAAAKLGITAEAWLEDALDAGRPIPNPGEYLSIPKEFMRWLLSYYISPEISTCKNAEDRIAGFPRHIRYSFLQLMKYFGLEWPTRKASA